MALSVGLCSDDSFASIVQLHHAGVAAHRLALPALAARDDRGIAKQRRRELWRIDVAVGDFAFSLVDRRRPSTRIDEDVRSFSAASHVDQRRCWPLAWSLLRLPLFII